MATGSLHPLDARFLKQEFDRRVEYINKRFREGRKGINTDRGRIYLYLGAPDKIEEYPMKSGGEGGELLWIYYRYELGIYFVDPRGMGNYTIGEIGGNLFEAIEMAKMGATFTEPSKTSSPLKFDLSYDKDRHEFRLSIPAKKLSFKEEGALRTADFDISFYIYNTWHIFFNQTISRNIVPIRNSISHKIQFG